MRIHRQNLLESARPELVLTGWTRRSTGPHHDGVSFQTLRNVGRGAALNLVLNSMNSPPDNLSTFQMSTRFVPILAPGDSIDLNAEISLHWQNVPASKSGSKFLVITVEMICWDARGIRHQTRYNLTAVHSKVTSWFRDRSRRASASFAGQRSRDPCGHSRSGDN